MKKLIKIWLTLMLAGVFTVGCVYVVSQQIVRQGADAPAAAIAYETVIDMVDKGQSAGEAASVKTDITLSLQPFAMVYDNDKNLITTSAGYGSEKYQFPASALNVVDENHDNRITWQPQKVCDLRQSQ